MANKMGSTSDDKKKKYYPIADNPVEAVKDIVAHVSQSVKDDFISGVSQGVLEQTGILSGKTAAGKKPEDSHPSPISGVLQEGQAIALSLLEKKDSATEKKEFRQTAYFEKVVFDQEKEKIKKEIEKLLHEIKTLALESTEVQMEFSQISMEVVPPAPGAYHFNFFVHLLSLIKIARQKISESRTWLSLFKSKKKKKKYWAMFKKHGTKFALSGERGIATQAG